MAAILLTEKLVSDLLRQFFHVACRENLSTVIFKLSTLFDHSIRGPDDNCIDGGVSMSRAGVVGSTRRLSLIVLSCKFGLIGFGSKSSGVYNAASFL
jgi:hypothetical protein